MSVKFWWFKTVVGIGDGSAADWAHCVHPRQNKIQSLLNQRDNSFGKKGFLVNICWFKIDVEIREVPRGEREHRVNPRQEYIHYPYVDYNFKILYGFLNIVIIQDIFYKDVLFLSFFTEKVKNTSENRKTGNSYKKIILIYCYFNKKYSIPHHMVDFVYNLDLNYHEYWTNETVKNESYKGMFLFTVKDFVSFITDSKSMFLMSTRFLKYMINGVSVPQFRV